MGGNANRITQHRSQKESKAKELTLLKQENKSLRKQNARLKRQLQKALDGYTEASEAAVEVAQEARVAAMEPEMPKARSCPSCASVDVTHLTLPPGTWQLCVCKSCSARNKVEPK